MAVTWTQSIERSYQEKNSKITHSAILTALLVAAIMYPFFLSLDYLVHPEMVPHSVVIRFVTAAFYLSVRWAIVRRQQPLRSPYWTVFLLFCVTSASLTSLCVLLGGYTSNYYMGLIVALVLANLFPWSVAQMSMKVLAVLFVYVAMMLVQAKFKIDQPSVFFVNIFVLSAIAVISILFAAISEHLRRQNFEQIVEIEQAKDEIYKLLQIRTRFFANVSHELRTPLALILGPARRLLSLEGVSDQSRLELATIERNVQVLLRHVSDLLDAAKGETGSASVNYQRVDISTLIRSCASRFEHLARERGDRFELSIPDSLIGEVDPSKFDRFLTNFLSNAFKFTPRQGTIRVEAEKATRNAASILVLKVSDSGPGIPHILRSQVFERFFQVEESSNRKHGGTGLGLAIAKDCIELHGGEVSIGESVEGGTEFKVILPLDAPAGSIIDESAFVQSSNGLDPDQERFEGALRAVLDQGTKQAAPFGAGTLLVVEDNSELSSFLQRILSTRWHVEKAYNGRQALELALARKPDLILTDLMLPEVSGEELLSAVREHTELADVPVIVLTAKADDQLRSDLLLKGAQDFQLKPFSPEELIARIDIWMDVKRSRELLQKELKTQQTGLLQLTQEIADKNARLHDALAQAEESRLKAQKACELRDQFIAVASHELRTPITALKLQAQLAQMTIPEDSVKAKLQSIDRQVNHLTKLVNEMFDLSILDQGKLTLKKKSFGVVSLLSSVIEKSGHYLKASVEVVNLSQEEDPMIEADPLRIEQVLTNLLLNAIKYGSGKPVRILVEAESGHIVVHLEDQGIGIAFEDQERIFERFERSVPYDKISGLGLGLYISREIVRAHGGMIFVKSRLGEGSVFSVRLPRLEMTSSHVTTVKPVTSAAPALASEFER